MAARKPKVEYYWSTHHKSKLIDGKEGAPPVRIPDGVEHLVNWRLVGANGEIVCESRQGARDKTDAVRSVTTAAGLFNGDVDAIRHVGPGKKPDGALPPLK